LDPERYLKDTCEWLYGSLGRIRKRKDTGIYFASSYEKRLRKASARVSESLGLEDPRVFEHIIHCVMVNSGMVYDARLRGEDGTDPSTVDMRRFKPELIETKTAKYNEPGETKVFRPGEMECERMETPGHIDARYRAAWEDENPGMPLPGAEPVIEELPEEPTLIERIMLVTREEISSAGTTA